MQVDSDPTSFTQAVKYSHWHHAMADEFNAFLNNDTWQLVPQTPTMNVIGCKWLFKMKFAIDGSLDRYKAHLVALNNH